MNMKTAPSSAIQINHAEFLDAGDQALNDLIVSLNMPDEIVETKPAFDEEMLNAAVSSVEVTEAMIAEATPEGVSEGAAPTGDACDVEVEKPTKAPKKAKAPKPETEAKEAKASRKYYTDKTERLKDKLGAGLVDYSILTLADAAVEESELVAKMEDTMTIIREMSGKAQNWAVKMVEWQAGKKTSLPEVTSRILSLLKKDGFITTGNTGNMYLNLIARPYSPGAARAMGGNNLIMLAKLLVVIPDGKGRYIANPDSLLLMKAQSMMTGSTTPAAVVPSEGDE